MNVRFTGASLAIAGAGLLAAAALRRRAGARNVEDRVGQRMGALMLPKIELSDRSGWLLTQGQNKQIVLTKDDGKWIIVSRSTRRPDDLMVEWEGGDEEEAIRRAEAFAGTHAVDPRRPSTPKETMEEQAQVSPRARVWKMVFDHKKDALQVWREDQAAAHALARSSQAGEGADQLQSYIEKQGDGWAYVYTAVHPHERSVLAGSGNQEKNSEEVKVKQAEKSYGVMPFNDWVNEVAKIRGRPLSEADPYRPAIEASQGETWYDVWLEGMKPQEAAKLGSRNLR
jgi:hypothetical protein